MENFQLKSEQSLSLLKPLSPKEDDINYCLCAMEYSLQSFHPSVNASTNPVLRKARFSLNAEIRIKEVIIQYCFLPAEIVCLLNIAKDRLKGWTSLECELSRNIGEEMGLRTNNISHYDILAAGIKNELDLDIDNSEQNFSTNKFLNKLKLYFAIASKSSAAGAIFALESAAVPELIIVAKLLNRYSDLSGKDKTLINLPARRKSQKEFHGNYNLDLFFAMHLLDFEVGHKNGLALALRKHHAKLALNLQELEGGFEFVLNQMDEWWEDLAKY